MGVRGQERLNVQRLFEFRVLFAPTMQFELFCRENQCKCKLNSDSQINKIVSSHSLQRRASLESIMFVFQTNCVTEHQMSACLELNSRFDG